MSDSSDNSEIFYYEHNTDDSLTDESDLFSSDDEYYGKSDSTSLPSSCDEQSYYNNSDHTTSTGSFSTDSSEDEEEKKRRHRERVYLKVNAHVNKVHAWKKDMEQYEEEWKKEQRDTKVKRRKKTQQERIDMILDLKRRRDARKEDGFEVPDEIGAPQMDLATMMATVDQEQQDIQFQQHTAVLDTLEDDLDDFITSDEEVKDQPLKRVKNMFVDDEAIECDEEEE